jgi:4'-phosphopantetheinyl transferase
MLDQDVDVVRALEELLDPAERRRADRFGTSGHRRRFVVGRGSLRTILAGYRDEPPAKLVFRSGALGKPALAEDHGPAALQFNVSHAQEIELVAIARGRQVGIDLEQVRPIDDADRIVADLFSAYERSVYFGLAEEQKRYAFFRCWTRKESYLKATGQGLSFPLDGFDVSLAPGDPPRLLRVQGHGDEPARWGFQELGPAPGFVGVVAVEGFGWRCRTLDYCQGRSG